MHYETEHGASSGAEGQLCGWVTLAQSLDSSDGPDEKARAGKQLETTAPIKGPLVDQEGTGMQSCKDLSASLTSPNLSCPPTSGCQSSTAFDTYQDMRSTPSEDIAST